MKIRGANCKEMWYNDYIMRSKKRVIVVGGGLSGSLVALHTQNFADVTLLTKASLQNNNSYLAQGGVAVVLPENTDDSFEQHIADTLQAGAGINDAENVATLVQDGASGIQWLRAQGLQFDADADGTLMYGLESAHSAKRILHAGGDATGKHILEFVQDKLRDAQKQGASDTATHSNTHSKTYADTPNESSHGNLQIVENAFVSELLVTKHGDERVYGVRYLDANDTEYIAYADYVVLATGGVGAIFDTTSNDTSIQGDGIALAFRSGAQLERMEYMQFHPTLLRDPLDNPSDERPDTDDDHPHALITEAIRGAGGRLVNEVGEYFMRDVHPDADLAPRDIVDRAVNKKIKAGHQVFIDISAIENFAQRFPTTTKNLNAAGVDISDSLIPVCPGAHFFMGGIKTDQNGATNLGALYAVGEVASTRVHGANRLASNSLLECIAFAKRVSDAIEGDNTAPLDAYPGVLKSSAQSVSLPTASELKARISAALGIVRQKAGLLDFIKYTAEFDTLKVTPSKAQMVLENIVLVARQIAGAALQNTQSLGAHYLEDDANS